MGKARLLAAVAALASAGLTAEAAADSVRRTPKLVAGLSCAQPTEAAGEAAGRPVLIEGLGTAGIAPDTASAEARAWFEQGVRLVWAFDEVEAIRAFREAQRLDPACALCAWGEAWARGPTINLQPRTEELPAARAAAERAVRLSRRLGERERRLIRAMRARTGEREFRNARYARTMQRLAGLYPDDDALNVIAADALMVGGDSTAGAAAAAAPKALLERVLSRNPDHSGAIHMYIHLTDWIDAQRLAEPYAERLGRIAPAASHLVHMPSHTFYGVGRYSDAAAVNVAAIAADRAFAERARPAASNYRTGLLGHNMHFAMNSALFRGDGATALSVARQFRERFPALEGWRRLIGSSVWFSEGLHGDPEAVLALPEPDKEDAFSAAMRHYARGEALARRGDGARVRAEAEAIRALREGPRAPQLGGEAGAVMAEIAQLVLEGRAAMLGGDHAAAATAYRSAMERQVAAGFGSDPPLWWYPVRRSLAAAQLASGDAAGARLQLLASLERWPNDPLALAALARAEQALGNGAEAERTLTRARAIWDGDPAEVPLARI